MYVCLYIPVRVCICIHSFVIRTVFCFLWALLTPHLFGVCLDDICFIVILLNNKSHVFFVKCIID